MKRTVLGAAVAASVGAACPALALPTPQQCEARANDTPAKLLECIQQKPLWDDLSRFQAIANANPGADGHGNRDTGTPGYRASVDDVARIMRAAGYRVTIQPYQYQATRVVGTPSFAAGGSSFVSGRDWRVARLSGGGTVSAPVSRPAGSGCAAGDFAGFPRGHVALMDGGRCAADAQVAHAAAAGAAAVIWPARGTRAARLAAPAAIPVVELRSAEANAAVAQGGAVQIDVRTQRISGTDYNVIADSPYGDPNSVVVIDAHLDSIFGAGMLDNASGSTTVLAIGRNLAHTKTLHQLRYIWFGGEELGLLGSHYYTTHLNADERRRIAFDMDVDVTATPNFDILVADPKFASNVKRFPPNVVPQSRPGNQAYLGYFARAGIVARPAVFGNDGTDSNSFSLIGIPNTGILTQQDCCKQSWETRLWGGFTGNYEGRIPSHDGGCVDLPNRWCDNLANNDPFILELASKGAAYVTFFLANDPALGK